MRKRAILYPVTEQQIPVMLYNNEFNSEYEIAEGIAPNCIADGTDLGWLDNRENTGIILHNQLEKAMEDAQVLLIPYIDEEKKALRRLAVRAIKDAWRRGMEIVCAMHLNEEEREQVFGNIDRDEEHFIDIFENKANEQEKSFIEMRRISVPVIWIGASRFPANETEIVLKMAARLKKDGYRVSVMGMRPEYKLFGFFYNSDLDEFRNGDYKGSMDQLIFSLNFLANKIVTKEKADVLLVEVPGAVFENGYYINDCGCYSYIVSRAVEPDYAIGTEIISNFSYEALEASNKVMCERLGFGFDCVHISNKELKGNETKSKKKFSYVYLPEAVVYKKLDTKKGTVSAYDLLKEDQFEQMYQQFLNTLGEEE